MRFVFVQNLLPASFLDELNSAIGGLQTAMHGQALAKGSRRSNRAALEELLNEAVTELLRLDAAIPNALREDNVTLEAWRVARQMRRPRSANKKRVEKAPPPSSEAA